MESRRQTYDQRKFTHRFVLLIRCSSQKTVARYKISRCDESYKSSDDFAVVEYERSSLFEHQNQGAAHYAIHIYHEFHRQDQKDVDQFRCRQTNHKSGKMLKLPLTSLSHTLMKLLKL